MQGKAWSLVVPLAAAIALGLATVRLVWEAGRALGLVVLAITLAAALAPIVDLLDRRLPRTMAVVCVYLAGAGLLAAIGWFIIPDLGQEMQELAQRSPQLIADLQQRLRDYLPPQVQLDQVLTTFRDQLLQMVRDAPMRLASFLVDILIVVFLSLYFLTIAPRIQWFTTSLFPARHRRRTALVFTRMMSAMGGYFRGVAIDAAIIGVLTWGMLQLIGVDFAEPLALVAALGEFVPYIGPVVAAVPAIAIASLQSLQHGLIVAIAYVVLQQIESHIVTPNVMRSQTLIRPATVIVALITGYAVGGLLGAIAAIPVFAAARVLLLHVVAPELRRRQRQPQPGASANAER